VILLTEMEHHSNLVPWQMAAEKAGARLRFMPVAEDGSLALERLPELLTPEVKLFAFTHISNSLGTITPTAEWCRAARAVGALTLVDAAQSAGHLPLDVREMGCDFLALSGHKMCGPTGIGALFARAELLDAMPPWHGGGEMILSVGYERSTYKNGPARFEAGTPNIAGAIALAAAAEYLDEIGRERIFDHDLALTRNAMARLREIPGLRLIGTQDPRGGLTSFVTEWAHPHDLTEYANWQGIALRGGHHCTQPLMRKFKLPGTTRASFYFYNTEAEVDRLIATMEKAHAFFA
jgi:cysteine desulfurase/selenocysteine lyase